MRVLFIVLIALFVVGCKEINSDASFQLATATDGTVYRINTKTGETNIIDKDRIRPINESDITKLKVGGFYEDENGKVMKYLGDLKFEKDDYSYLWK